jgi:catechol 2,3-dioxygenase-like lactoylglutathione lyase family enzyme
VIHHVQISCPRGSEETLRAFYSGLLGLAEVPKPPALAARGGCWFVGPAPAASAVGRAPAAGGIELHLGVEEPFAPARKAHPGLLWPALDELAQRLTAAGHDVRWADEGELPGMRRFHTDDPHGNRLEFLAPVSTLDFEDTATGASVRAAPSV